MATDPAAASSDVQGRVVRPASIVWFEILFLVSAVLGTLQAAFLGLNLTAAGTPAPVVIGLAAGATVTLAVSAMLALLVSRRRSRIARWLLVILILVVTPFTLYAVVTQLRVAFTPIGGVNLLQVSLQVVSAILLLLPSARAWTSRKVIPSPAMFE